MKMRQTILLLLVVAGLASMLRAQVQSQIVSDEPSKPAAGAPTTKSELAYTRPTERTKLHDYLFDTIGPYPLVGAALLAGLNQAYDTPPEWNQGLKGYGRRFGSVFGIETVSTTTRYALAEAFREDTTYYRCECKRFFPRLGHALISTLTARHGDDGNRVFSFPSLVAPYAGSMTAVSAWYPSRYGPKDAFRMGNYTLLGYAGANIALEFIYGGPHSIFARMHLTNAHKPAGSDPNP
jgi:hypothetical protein